MAEVMVRESPGRGRGVFALRDFAEGELIEECPVIVASRSDAKRFDDTVLVNYYFGWDPADGSAAVVLGYGSLYNHLDDPNALYQKQLDRACISVVAVKPIAAGDEIFIRYNTTHDDGAVWFDVL